ncbi:ferritin-like domain-containing protein, partial [Coprinopsis sp. MPI-PUGE-AT-0042]
DIKILNLALSLSHLTSSFYNTSLSHLSRDDFISQGYEGWMYDRYCEINDHQVQHVWFLESAIGAAGGQGVERCDEYKEEKQKQVWEFVKLSEALETISTSALNGAVKEIASRDYASVIASMMGVEARHASWIDSAIKKKSPWNTAFETPISFDQTYTLLSRFAKSCPGSNDALLPPSLRPHSQLDLPEDVKAGHPLLLGDLSSLPQNIDNAEDNALFAAFLLGTGTFVQPVHRDDDDDKKFWVNVPKELEGQGAVYIIIVQQRLSDAARGLRVEDGNTVAGPGLLVFPSKSGKSEGGDDWEEGYNALSCN